MKFEVIQTRTAPSIKVIDPEGMFYLHSKYDPIKEAEKWVIGNDKKIRESSELIVVGMGAGHHIRSLLEKDQIEKILVFDFNRDFSNWLLDSGLINDIIIDERVHYYPVTSRKHLEFFSVNLQKNIIVYQPSLKVFSKEFYPIKTQLDNFIIQERTIIDQKDLLFQNFKANLELNDLGINEFYNFKIKSMILVSAGPSLTKQLPLLKKASESKQFVIGTVGTAYKPLVKLGIIPDFVMISDPLDLIVEQFHGTNTEVTTLFYLSTANNFAVSGFKGRRHIVWQKGFEFAENQANKRNEPLIKTGGSVATCLLDLMIRLGAKRVALIGQDLAFTDGKSHAEHTHALREVAPNLALKKVPNYYQDDFVNTSKNLFVYLTWFSRYASNNETVELWNCTEGGAYIDNWIHRPFIDFVNTKE